MFIFTQVVDEADLPYIAAKFLQRSIPYTFVLGDGLNYEGFINKKLQPSKYHKIFVRAYVDTPQKHLYTSSPFSPEMSLDMMQVDTEGIWILDLSSILIVRHSGHIQMFYDVKFKWLM